MPYAVFQCCIAALLFTCPPCKCVCVWGGGGGGVSFVLSPRYSFGRLMQLKIEFPIRRKCDNLHIQMIVALISTHEMKNKKKIINKNKK